jgi:hypothetical protein
MKNKIDNDDDIPELEDLSEELNKIRGNNSNANDEGSEIKINVVGEQNTIKQTEPRKIENNKPSNENSSFKFKKGFFLKNDQTQPNNTQQVSNRPVDLTHIKSTPTEQPKNKLIDNVKNEVKSNNSGSGSGMFGDIMGKKDEWLTPDLLNKIAQKPHLLKFFMDPQFSEAIKLMQKDPEKAKATYGGNPHFNEFIKEFSGIMAEHFNTLGTKEENTNIDIEVAEILKDQKVAYYINILQTTGRLDVDDQLYKDPATFEKIKKLIDKGFLKMNKE